MLEPEDNKQVVLKKVEAMQSRFCQEGKNICPLLTKVRDAVEVMPAADVIQHDQMASDDKIVESLKPRAVFANHFHASMMHRKTAGETTSVARMKNSLHTIRSLPLPPNQVLAGTYQFDPKSLRLYGVATGGAGQRSVEG